METIYKITGIPSIDPITWTQLNSFIYWTLYEPEADREWRWYKRDRSPLYHLRSNTLPPSFHDQGWMTDLTGVNYICTAI